MFFHLLLFYVCFIPSSSHKLFSAEAHKRALLHAIDDIFQCPNSKIVGRSKDELLSQAIDEFYAMHNDNESFIIWNLQFAIALLPEFAAKYKQKGMPEIRLSPTLSKLSWFQRMRLKHGDNQHKLVTLIAEYSYENGQKFTGIDSEYYENIMAIYYSVGYIVVGSDVLIDRVRENMMERISNWKIKSDGDQSEISPVAKDKLLLLSHPYKILYDKTLFENVAGLRKQVSPNLIASMLEWIARRSTFESITTTSDKARRDQYHSAIRNVIERIVIEYDSFEDDYDDV